MPDHTRPGSSLEATIAQGQAAVRAALQAPRGAELAPSTRTQLELLSACRKTLAALAALVRDPNSHLRSPHVDSVQIPLLAADFLQDRLAREIAQLQQVTP